jgi:molecular chaperone GrpE (heat shock protein)
MGGQTEGELDSSSPVEVTEIEVTDEGSAEEGFEERVESGLAQLDSRVVEFQRLLDRQAELTERLHAENQSLRAGELREAQLPFIRDLIRLSDDLERMRAVAAESAGDLGMVHASLTDILLRNGVQRFEVEQGEPFDPRLHSAAGIEPTDREELDKAVAEVVRAGFRWDSGEVIRVAEVRAYRFSGSG